MCICPPHYYSELVRETDNPHSYAFQGSAPPARAVEDVDVGNQYSSCAANTIFKLLNRVINASWGNCSVGSALSLRSRCQPFDSAYLHFKIRVQPLCGFREAGSFCQWLDRHNNTVTNRK
jgi:hypothetical protein